MLHQKLKDAELRAREGKRFAFYAQALSPFVQGKGLFLPCIPAGSGPAGTPEDSLRPQQELLHGEGLGDIVVHAQPKAVDNVFPGIFRREHDKGDIGRQGILLQEHGKPLPGHAPQHQIQDDEDESEIDR